MTLSLIFAYLSFIFIRASGILGKFHTTKLRAQSEPKLFPEDVISLCATDTGESTERKVFRKEHRGGCTAQVARVLAS